jgi:predicted nucleic acid-binding protein
LSQSPRPPSRALAVDANIVLNAALGRRSRPLLEFVAARRLLFTSARARDEVLGRAGSLKTGATSATELASTMLALTTVANPDLYADHLDRAAEALRLAPASRNGSTDDAHVLALAWVLDADIWSHDRDFAGTGWPSWSSANLGTALADP